MNPIKVFAFASGVFLFSGSVSVLAAAGLATRDLNPLLQQFYLPVHVSFSETNGWLVDHSFFITNTLQDESKSDEDLLIDVENYRYELGFSYRNDSWLLRVNIPFIGNRGGKLDGLIEDWHDFFGLPGGKRNEFPENEVNIEYTRDGVVEYSQTSPSSGLGDIAFAIGNQEPGEPGYFIGIELPSGSESDFSGNEAIDLALWIVHEKQIDTTISVYGLVGLSLPGDEGNLQGLVADQIWLAQLGVDYRFSNSIVGTVQFDLHSQTIEDSELKAFGNSLQIQLGLGFLKLIGDHRLDLFFSEDILVGSAPDISFGARLIQQF